MKQTATQPSPTPQVSPPVPPKVPQRRNFELANSRPVMPVPAKLQSHQAQVIFNRNFAYMDRNLWNLGVILRHIGEAKKVAHAESRIETFLKNFEKRLKKETEQTQQIMADNGINPESLGIHYNRPLEVVAECSNPRSARVVNLIKLMDELMLMGACLWYGGVYNDVQHAHLNRSWMTASMMLSGNIAKEIVIARNASQLSPVERRQITRDMGAAKRGETVTPPAAEGQAEGPQAEDVVVQ